MILAGDSQTDMFGAPMPAGMNGKKAKGHIARRKQSMMYSVAENKDESCKTCKNLIGGNYSRFYKCKLIGISHSLATDVRLRNTCKYWKTK